MQTFIPIATTNYAEIAKLLDNKRLHKQALEGWQILMVLLEVDPQGNDRKPKGWVNHPAVKMWRGHELHLFYYITAMVDEWKSRGYKSTLNAKALDTLIVAWSRVGHSAPEWITDDSVATTHRQALLVKDYKWYSQWGWPEDTGVVPTDYDYVWPKEMEKTNGN